MVSDGSLPLLDQVNELAPLFRKHAEAADHERRLARPVVEALSEAGFFRLWTPRSLGGLELDPPSALRVIEALSRIDSAVGWNVAVTSGLVPVAARLPDAGAEEIFGPDPNVVVAGSSHPPGQASRVDGGFRLTGRWPFASGCHNSHWVFQIATVKDGEQKTGATAEAPEIIGLFFPIRQVEIIDVWSVMGMRGTGSNDVAVTDLFVPAHRTFPFTPGYNPGAHFRGPLYRYPVIGHAALPLATVALGIARGAIDAFASLARDKVPAMTTTPLRERPATQALLARAEGALRSARLLQFETTRAVWEETAAQQAASLARRADLLLAATNSVQRAADAVDWIYSAAGTTGIFTKSPLERHFRDIHVLTQHAFSSFSRYETVGQVYLGLPPDFALVTF